MDGYRQLMVKFVLIISIIITSTGGQVLPPGARQWRWCFLCSGKSPDRECESYPQYVANGRVNCTRDFCTSTLVYDYRIYGQDRGSRLLSGRSLTPADLEVVSVSRDCNDVAHGNECVRGGPGGAMFTCYSTCRHDYCNGDIRAPSWGDLSQYRQQNQTTADVIARNNLGARHGGNFPRTPTLFGPTLHVPRPRFIPHVNTQRFSRRPVEVHTSPIRVNEQVVNNLNHGQLKEGAGVEPIPVHIIGQPATEVRQPRVLVNDIQPKPYPEIHNRRPNTPRLLTGHQRTQRIGTSGAFLVPPEEWKGHTARGRPRTRPTPGEMLTSDSIYQNRLGRNGYAQDGVTVPKLERNEPLESNITGRRAENTGEDTTAADETAPSSIGKAGPDTGKRIEVHRGKGHKTLSRKGKTTSSSVMVTPTLLILLVVTSISAHVSLWGLFVR